MSRQTCVICNKNKTALRCDSCGDVSCKKCVQFIDEEQFEMISLLPEELKNKTFCMNCYHQGIDEKLTNYADIAEKAKGVDVYSFSQTKETRRIKRVESPVEVNDCEDKKETLLRLAFLTAEKGFNTIVDVKINSKKIGGAGKSHQKLVWYGSGIPVDPSIRK